MTNLIGFEKKSTGLEKNIIQIKQNCKIHLKKTSLNVNVNYDYINPLSGRNCKKVQSLNMTFSQRPFICTFQFKALVVSLSLSDIRAQRCFRVKYTRHPALKRVIKNILK